MFGGTGKVVFVKNEKVKVFHSWKLDDDMDLINTYVKFLEEIKIDGMTESDYASQQIC